VICNGFKERPYIENIARLINTGHKTPSQLLITLKNLICCKVKSRINSKLNSYHEEEPKFEFYTSRLGIGYKNIVPFYKRDQRK
jgi:arginine decarboxylase